MLLLEMYSSTILSVFILVLFASAQQIASDPGVYGPQLELVHIYNDEFPTGISTMSGIPSVGASDWPRHRCFLRW